MLVALGMGDEFGACFGVTDEESVGEMITSSIASPVVCLQVPQKTMGLLLKRDHSSVPLNTRLRLEADEHNDAYVKKTCVVGSSSTAEKPRALVCSTILDATEVSRVKPGPGSPSGNVRHVYEDSDTQNAFLPSRMERIVDGRIHLEFQYCMPHQPYVVSCNEVK